jgi:hypothetical protein
MADDKRAEHEQRDEEQLDESAELLPNREVMSIIRAPTDPAVPMDPSDGGRVTLPIEPNATE